LNSLKKIIFISYCKPVTGAGFNNYINSNGTGLFCLLETNVGLTNVSATVLSSSTLTCTIPAIPGIDYDTFNFTVAYYSEAYTNSLPYTILAGFPVVEEESFLVFTNTTSQIVTLQTSSIHDLTGTGSNILCRLQCELGLIETAPAVVEPYSDITNQQLVCALPELSVSQKCNISVSQTFGETYADGFAYIYYYDHAPVPLSAIFASTSSSIVVTFDIAVGFEGIPGDISQQVGLTCGDFFNATYTSDLIGPSAQCFGSSPFTITIRLFDDATIVPGDALVFSDSPGLIHANALYGLIVEGDIIVQGPLSPSSPTVVVTAANVYPNCGTIVIDASSSFDAAGTNKKHRLFSFFLTGTLWTGRPHTQLPVVDRADRGRACRLPVVLGASDVYPQPLAQPPLGGRDVRRHGECDKLFGLFVDRLGQFRGRQCQHSHHHPARRPAAHRLRERGGGPSSVNLFPFVRPTRPDELCLVLCLGKSHVQPPRRV